MTEILNTIAKALLKLLDQAIATLPGIMSALIVLFLTKYAVQLVLKLADETGRRAIKSTSLQLLLRKICRIGVWTIGILVALRLGCPWI